MFKEFLMLVFMLNIILQTLFKRSVRIHSRVMKMYEVHKLMQFLYARFQLLGSKRDN